ncbi:Repressor of RNA polymerase III transcription MAF1 homolog [Durusdinium trenchii]|uniref:Repressor of RNA polymerase III transcription MAF1 homolog n=1 Tax=Durusdinium trenchii TaxID=1381693 RepID=A0ABP0L4A0_9DINO
MAAKKKQGRLALMPEGVVLRTAEFLDPEDIVQLQMVSTAFYETFEDDALWKGLCKRRWEQRSASYHLTKRREGSLLRQTVPWCGWKNMFRATEEEGRRANLRLDDLFRLRWFFNFSRDAGGRGRYACNEVNFEMCNGKLMLNVVNYPPLPCSIEQDGRQLIVGAFPPHEVVRLSNWEWKIENENVALWSVSSQEDTPEGAGQAARRHETARYLVRGPWRGQLRLRRDGTRVDSDSMKFLDVEELNNVTTFLEGCRVGDRRLRGRVEAYSCKAAGEDKRLAKVLEQQYTDELKQELGVGQMQAMSPIGELDNKQTRRLLINLICTMNATFPDYDFSSLKADQFVSENLGMVVNSVNMKLSEIVETQAQGRNFLDQLWGAIDKQVHLREAEVFSYVPNLEDDPFSVPGMLWSFNYFFHSRTEKKIVFLTCCSTMPSSSGVVDVYGSRGEDADFDDEDGDDEDGAAGGAAEGAPTDGVVASDGGKQLLMVEDDDDVFFTVDDVDAEEEEEEEEDHDMQDVGL